MISTEKPGTPQELVHYGVKGMKWGVRRERRRAERQIKREAKAQKFVKKSAALEKQIGELQTRKSTQNFLQKKLVTDRKISRLESKKAQADKDAEAKRQGHLSRGQKQALGAAAVAGLITAGVVYSAVSSGRARQLSIKGQEAIFGKQFQFKQNSDLSRVNMNPLELDQKVAKSINPGFGSKKGAAQNCRRCTFAYEMRRRGYDVAATTSRSGSGQTSVGLYNVLDTKGKDQNMFTVGRRALKSGGKDPMTQTISKLAKNSGGLEKIPYQGATHPKFATPPVQAKDVFQVLSRQPERSRGELTTTWRGGGLHSMAYEIIRGKPHIFDTQSGRMFSSPESFASSLPPLKDAGFTRLDNMPLDENFLRRWLTHAK